MAVTSLSEKAFEITTLENQKTCFILRLPAPFRIFCRLFATCGLVATFRLLGCSCKMYSHFGLIPTVRGRSHFSTIGFVMTVMCAYECVCSCVCMWICICILYVHVPVYVYVKLCAYMFVYAYGYIHICVSAHLHGHAYLQVYVYVWCRYTIYVCIGVNMCIPTCICTYICICSSTCICMCICTCICIRACVSICTFRSMRTYNHTLQHACVSAII